MNFNSETKVKDIALSNPAARQVLEDAGLDYCCGGGKSLHEACLHADVPAEEILNRLQENSKARKCRRSKLDIGAAERSDPAYPGEAPSVRSRGDRSRATLLEKVSAKHGENHPEIAEIQRSFQRSRPRDDHAHAEGRTDSVPVHRRGLEHAANGNGSVEPPFFQTVRNPIQAMMREHDAAGELVRQIRKASSEYTAPADACTSYKALYQDLREFEADLHQHVHLENNILFPRAVEMEAAVA